jgi:serine/threonine-protein kinase
VEGELLGVPGAQRSEPASAFMRFCARPVAERVAALDVVFRLHFELAALGYVAVDSYDGCSTEASPQARAKFQPLAVCGVGAPQTRTKKASKRTSTCGEARSDRFMAPEEYERGARIDERTTVFTLGRTL